MQRIFDETRDKFMMALDAQNWNDVIVHATELLLMTEDLPHVWANRGIGLHALGHHLDAMLNLDRALALEKTAAVYNNKGAVLFDLKRMQEAIDHYKMACDLDPNSPQTFMNVGLVHKWNKDSEKALISYRKCVELDPEYADGHLALSLGLLKAGFLKEGFEEFEWRWKTKQMVPRKHKKPVWNGEDLTNKTILVYGEQGFGDVIQFARYTRLLGKAYPKCKIIFESKQPLKRLLESIPEIYAVVNVGDKLPEVDYISPVMSLAKFFTHDWGTIPYHNPEFMIKRDDVEAWDRRLQLLYDKCPDHILKVGLCWAGLSRTHQPGAMKIDALRSTVIGTFAPLGKIPGIAWVSLQKGAPAEQAKKGLPAGMTFGDFTDDMYDFYETAAAIENLDLVISVDTAVVHVAASLGKPTWLLSRWDGCWRWFGDRSDSPWYPSLRQFVQPKSDDWAGMVTEVEKELRALIESKSQPQQLELTLAK